VSVSHRDLVLVSTKKKSFPDIAMQQKPVRH
jgi:hypothetical protein